MNRIAVMGMVAGLALGLAEKAAADGEAQVIRTPDGAKLTFLGVTQGKQHRAPKYERLTTGNWIYSPTNSTVAWIKVEHGQERRPYYELLILDRENTGGVVMEAKRTSHVRPGVDLRGFPLEAYPRWDSNTVLRLRPHAGEVFEGEFLATNAPFGELSNWTAEGLPQTRADGDLQVTLLNFQAGVPIPGRPGEAELKDSPANRCVRLGLEIFEGGQPTAVWQAGLAQTVDAAGNIVRSTLREYPRNGFFDYPRPGHPGSFETEGYFYRPGLWPGVVPWKVRLEFRRISDFSEEEIVTLANLPVQAGTQEDFAAQWTWDQSKTNQFFATADVNGIRLKVLRPLLIPDEWEPAKKRVSVIIYTDNDTLAQAMRLTLLEATDETGQEIHTPFSPNWAAHFSLDFPNVGAIKTLTLKLALHRKRFVEFTATPTVFER